MATGESEIAVRAEGLVKSFGSTKALDGVDLEIPRGQVLGLLGPNGAGKTTTVRILTTLLRPDAGRAYVAGHDVLGQPAEVRRSIGLSGQYAAVDEHLTGAENLYMVGRLYGMSRADARARARELLARFRLTDDGDRPAKGYSGGMRRRLDLAGALVAKPAVVALDEPTTGLDPQSRANLWNHIAELHAEQGVTVFLTTHYLDEADALCDRILVIDGGRIVAEGTPDELKARVSGDRVEIGLDHTGEQAAEAAALVERLDGAHEVSVSGGLVRFRVPRGDVVLPELLRAFDSRGLSMTSMQVQRPTLDDVFLTMTGRSLREAQSGTEEATDVA